ncbi:hypothetical protein [Kribbella karoonensis]|uniref:hypothetical protein n=1 Tax=Kribbella karoonensis TaxID=324851 RepID=UPI0031D2052B
MDPAYDGDRRGLAWTGRRRLGAEPPVWIRRGPAGGGSGWARRTADPAGDVVWAWCGCGAGLVWNRRTAMTSPDAVKARRGPAWAWCGPGVRR